MAAQRILRRRTMPSCTVKSRGPGIPTLMPRWCVSTMRKTVTRKPGAPGSNCIFYEPVSGRVQGWRGRAPPPPAASALSPSARRFFCLACARSETERLSGARSAHDVVRRIPLLAALDHDVENADQLAHAGGQRDLL